MAATESETTYSALNGLMHVDSPIMDTTLCGDALEGEGGVDGMSMRCVPQKISCQQCVAIIEYAVTIPRKHWRKRKKRASNG